MILGKKNIVHRKVLALTLREEKGAYALQRQIGDLYKEHAIPTIGQAFDELAPGNDVIRIEKLEIDLGEISMGDLENAFTHRIQKKAEAALSDLLAGVGKSAKTNLSSIKAKALDVFIHFLRTGRLPWYASSTEFIGGVESFLIEWDDLTMTEWNRLRTLFNASPLVLKRLIRQFESEFHRYFLENAFNIPHYYVVAVEKKFQGLSGHSMKLVYAERMWELIREHGEALQPETLAAKIMEGAEVNTETDITNIQQDTEIKHKNQSEETKKSPENDPDIGPLQPGQSEHAKDESTMNTKKSSSVEEKKLVNGDEASIMEVSQTVTPQEENAWHIDHAGLVLLAPFMPAFYQNLGLLEENRFKTEYDRDRAVHLLHYLATGCTEGMEFEQQLHKVLCGIPKSRPLVREVMISKNEKKEAERLLTETISHWSVLKNTSPHGLREGFLQRTGKLTDHGPYLQLQVAQKPQDVLLDKLPWTISMVQLPWMEKRIQVDWTT